MIPSKNVDSEEVHMQHIDIDTSNRVNSNSVETTNTSVGPKEEEACYETK